jgi:hypothetical protein
LYFYKEKNINFLFQLYVENPTPCNDTILKKLNEAATTSTISVDENVWQALKGLDTEN